MKKKKRLFLFLLLCSAGLIIWRQWLKNSEDGIYLTQPVINSQLRLTVSATGTLKPIRLVNVGSQVSGTIRELLVDYNDHVKAGQLMMVLDDHLFQAKVNASAANVKIAQAQRDLAKIKYYRLLKLRQAEATPQEELDIAQANLEIAQAEHERQKAALFQDQYNLNRTKIVSPIDGVIINRAVDIGQTVASSFQTPNLFDIAEDMSNMQINAKFVEADIGRLKPGLKATFTVDAFPGQTFKGELLQIRLNPTVTSNVVTYDVVLNVANPEGILLPGMTAYVDIELYREDNVVLVPNIALNYRPYGTEQITTTSSYSGSNYIIYNGGIIPYQEQVASNDNLVRGIVYVLDQAGQPREVQPLLGATDLRFTVVKSSNLLAGELVIIGEKTQDGSEKSPFSSLKLLTRKI
ncbi:MAG: efflux RND transporter periplasmic adaptor subunit [Deltaproteobacteria bacterium]|jgi:HlyD family secretion protein|nr:efflux RND transporter periplasmic adaptor subunit [Deltaproteobacteria bacterium]